MLAARGHHAGRKISKGAKGRWPSKAALVQSVYDKHGRHWRKHYLARAEAFLKPPGAKRKRTKASVEPDSEDEEEQALRQAKENKALAKYGYHAPDGKPRGPKGAQLG